MQAFGRKVRQKFTRRIRASEFFAATDRLTCKSLSDRLSACSADPCCYGKLPTIDSAGAACAGYILAFFPLTYFHLYFYGATSQFPPSRRLEPYSAHFLRRGSTDDSYSLYPTEVHRSPDCVTQPFSLPRVLSFPIVLYAIAQQRER